MSYISDYLNTRRSGWPYDGRYTVDRVGENGFVAKIDGNVAGLAWADMADGEAVMHMNLKPDYKEYGIGTELLHKLMDYLIECGCRVVRYSILVEIGHIRYMRTWGSKLRAGIWRRLIS